MSTVVVRADRTELRPGESVQARAEARTANGEVIADARFHWTSTNTSVLTVDARGRVSAIGNGTASIKAAETKSGVSGSLEFRVTTSTPPPEGNVARVVLGPASGQVPVGSHFQLLAEAFDRDDQLLQGVAFAWSSSDEGVLTVDASGRMFAVGEGRAEVTVRAEGRSATASFEVVPLGNEPVSASWEPVEPIIYPHVRDLALGASGEELLLTYQDLHRRSQPEEPWTRVFANDTGLDSITPHPTRTDEIWAVDGHAILVSRNGGLFFEQAFLANGIDRVVFHPLDAGVLYALDNGGRPSYRSGDGGETWNAPEPDCSSASAYLSWSPADPQVVVALHADGVLCRTVDGGSTWTASMQPPGNTHYLGFGAGGSLWALSSEYVSGSGTFYRLHRSDDLGDTWSEVRSTSDNDFNGSVYIHPTDHQVIFVENYTSLWFSTDGGTTFSKVPLGAASIQHDPANPAVLYGVSLSSNPDGRYPVLRSTDYGQSWSPVQGVTAPTRNLRVRFLSGRVYLLTDLGLWASTDGGVSFSRFHHNRGWAGQYYHFGQYSSLALDPNDPATLLAGYAGLHSTQDAGDTWETWSEEEVYHLAWSPLVPNCLYGVRGGADVLRSDDGGRTWTWVGRVPYQHQYGGGPLLSATGVPDLLYAVAGGGVYRSEDGGATWEQRSQGLEHVNLYGHYLNDLVVHPDNANLLFYATGHAGVYRSDDGGGQWQPINRGLRNLEVSSLCLATDGQTLFAGLRDGGVYVSLDQGGTWSFADGIGHYRVMDVACDPSDANVVYAATYGGVYKSVDKGSTWVLASDGLTTPFVDGILVSHDGQRLYLHTLETGIFRGIPSDTEGAVFRTQGMEEALLRVLEAQGTSGAQH